jgi:hypothetical protein
MHRFSNHTAERVARRNTTLRTVEREEIGASRLLRRGCQERESTGRGCTPRPEMDARTGMTDGWESTYCFFLGCLVVLLFSLLMSITITQGRRTSKAHAPGTAKPGVRVHVSQVFGSARNQFGGRLPQLPGAAVTVFPVGESESGSQRGGCGL